MTKNHGKSGNGGSASTRAQSLFERSLIARQELDDAEALFQASTAQIDLARAQFDQARAQREELRINLANTVLVSPVDGFVGRRYLDPGAYVQPGTPIAEVLDLSTVEVTVPVREPVFPAPKLRTSTKRSMVSPGSMTPSPFPPFVSSKATKRRISSHRVGH